MVMGEFNVSVAATEAERSKELFCVCGNIGTAFLEFWRFLAKPHRVGNQFSKVRPLS
jgi:hypothetical protein